MWAFLGSSSPWNVTDGRARAWPKFSPSLFCATIISLLLPSLILFHQCLKNRFSNPPFTTLSKQKLYRANMGWSCSRFHDSSWHGGTHMIFACGPSPNTISPHLLTLPASVLKSWSLIQADLCDFVDLAPSIDLGNHPFSAGGNFNDCLFFILFY